MLHRATAWQRSPIHFKNKLIVLFYHVAASCGVSGVSWLLPELGLDVAGTGGAGLDLLLLLLPQDPLC